MGRHPNLCRTTLACGLVLAWVSLPSKPGRADEIVLIVDQNGNKVYINTGDASKGPDNWLRQGFRLNRPTTSSPPPPAITHLVDSTASRYDVDPELVHAIIKVESDYDPKAVSRKGAMGLMQLVPATAARFGVTNAFDPKQNIEGGVNYLKYLLDLFQGDLRRSLAAYNAGEHSVMKAGGVPPISETKDYVRKVTGRYKAGSAPASKEVSRPSIRRYVDDQGVVHYTNE